MSSTLTDPYANTDGNIHALLVNGDKLYAGGSFSRIGGVAAKSIAVWNSSTNTWSPLGNGLGDDIWAQVNALAMLDGKLYAGGMFTRTKGETVKFNNIAVWDGTCWSAVGDGFDSNVNVLEVFDGKLYAGGLFTRTGRVSANKIAAWDGTSWSALGAGLTGQVTALIVFNRKLHAGCSTSVGEGDPTNRIAVWNGASWSGFPVDLVGQVNALAVFNGKLHAGGIISKTKDQAVKVNNIAAWDGTSWSSLGNGLRQRGGCVEKLAVVGNTLYAGGSYYVDTDMQCLAAWDGQNWSFGGAGLKGNSTIYAVTVSGSDLYVGGDAVVDGDWRKLGSNITVLDTHDTHKFELPITAGSADFEFAVDRDYTTQDGKYCLRFQSDGNLVVYDLSGNSPFAVWALNGIDYRRFKGGKAVFSTTGNLQITGFNDSWNSNTGEDLGAQLTVDEKGKLCIRTKQRIVDIPMPSS